MKFQPDLRSNVSDEAQAAKGGQLNGHSAHLPGFLLDLAARCEEGQGEDGTVGGTAITSMGPGTLAECQHCSNSRVTSRRDQCRQQAHRGEVIKAFSGEAG